MIKYYNTPKSFILQWHITERCNWKCKHCYRNKNVISKEMNLEQMLGIAKQYASMISKWDIKAEHARIHIAGGEPMLREDFLSFVKALSNYKKTFRWGVLSNGSLLTNKLAEALKDAGVYMYQISLEGCEDINDAIRGKGSFKKIMDSINLLVKHKIPVRVSMTVTRKNIKDVQPLVGILKNAGVSYFSTRRLVPIGAGRNLKKHILSPQELREYYRWTEETNRRLHNDGEKLKINIGCDSGIFNNEKPEDSVTQKNFCGVINGRVLVILPNGDVLPCRRLPIIVGNVFKKNLYDVWISKSLRNLRSITNSPLICKSCKNFEACFGGAKCITYASTQKLDIPDIQCWKHNRS